MQVLDVWCIVCFAHGTLGEAQRCCGRLTGWGRHIYDPTENYILKTLTRMRFSWAFAVFTMRSDKQTNNINHWVLLFQENILFVFLFHERQCFSYGNMQVELPRYFLSLTHNIPFITIYCKRKIHCTIDIFQYLLRERFFFKTDFVLLLLYT